MSNLVSIWCLKGDNYLELKQYDAAIKCYEKALELDSNCERAKKNKVLACRTRAQELFDSKDYLLALEYCNVALQIQPHDEDCLQQIRLLHISIETEKTYKTVRQSSSVLPMKDDVQELTTSLRTAIAKQEIIEIRKINEKLTEFQNFLPVKTTALNVAPSLVGELAALSRDVYFVDPNFDPGSNQIRYPLPAGWTMFDAIYSSTTGYAGAVYIKDANNPAGPSSIVWAHKGTNFTKTDDVIADIGIFAGITLGAILDKMNSFVQFASQVGPKLIKQYGDKLKNAIPMMTGHSLGAVLAQLLSGGMPTVTFENPGARPIIIDYYKKINATNDQIARLLFAMSQGNMIYNAHVNAINSCNEQIGQIFELVDLPYNYGILNEQMQLITSHWFLNPNYAYYTVLDQHDMQNIADYLRANGAVIPITAYPVGLLNGYAAYLNPERVTYWKGYAKEIWNRKAEVRDKYQLDFEKYFTDFNIELTKIWQEASSSKTAAAQIHWKDIQPAPTLTSVQASTEVGIFKNSGVSFVYEHSFNPSLKPGH